MFLSFGVPYAHHHTLFYAQAPYVSLVSPLFPVFIFHFLSV